MKPEIFSEETLQEHEVTELDRFILDVFAEMILGPKRESGLNKWISKDTSLES